ncbi:MAG: undecaprenyl-diphosphate phosphatase [Microlunatus sp.]
MGWLEALVLGIVQGLTEFLPISSSAHLSIIGQFYGGKDPGSAFTAISQLGTETAVIIYFRKDIWKIIEHWCLALVGKIDRNDPEARMGWLVIIGSIPIVVLGLLFQDQIDHTLRNLWITVAMLAGFGIVIGIADHFTKNIRPLDSLTWGHGILYGLAQSLALIPGVSRSGATIAAGLALGYKREAAAKYAFLLAIPAVVGSGFFKLFDISSDPVEPAWGPIILATVVAFGVGLAVIHWLLKYVSTHTFKPFVIYRLGLAALVTVLLLTGVLQPLPSA